ncbi:MAG: hypothetical protein ACETVM_01350 [Candidatus Bathyarchaeia archaeon]
MWTIDFALMVLIFGEFFLFLAIVSYFGMKREKGKKTKTRDFPFYEAVWTKSKMVLTVYSDHLEMFVPSSRVKKQKRVKGKKKNQSRN